MRHRFERLGRCLETPGPVVRATGQEIDSLEQRRIRAKRSRILEDRERFIETPIVDLELRKLEETFGQRWQLGVSSAQLAEDPQGVLAASGAQFASREIPLRQRAARLDRDRWPTFAAPGSTAFVGRDRADRAS